MRVRVAAVLLALATGAAAGVAGASEHHPDYRYHQKRDISNLWLLTDACPGFASTSPLLFAGTIRAAYSSWVDESNPIGPIEEGYAQIHVSASDGSHSYRIHQRYRHPREYREYIYGYATTVVVRDDGATMEGWSWLGIDPLQGGGGTEGVWWLEAPTCKPARR